ncbi:MAG TPA: flagellar biosynthesis protein FlhA [Gammaproteobacteria bacterium]|nr:flagellar biosynthesis protein FlhA [Gammaproteobacteria bacterium]
MSQLGQSLGNFVRTGMGTPVLLIALLVMIVLPLPPMALDMFFTFNIALALVVILMTVYAPRPLEFSVFPSVLLLATLLRLALNVASTRVVLMNGHAGTDAAGKVIEAFGDFVVGGNYAVGFVVFAILVIINFVVVTKGAGRVSEVSARFTLDALPGKQMAIDADLNSGLITQEEARLRRTETAAEADFYGSMDGASKFVRGDAVAGILILFINIIGGLVIGTTTHDMAIGDAGRTYVLLTIGDGLAAQIPSLLLSSATAIIVTRVSAAGDMGQDVIRQLFGSARAISIAAVIIGMLGLVPGMPNLVFLALAAALGTAAWFLHKRSQQVEVEVLPDEPVEASQPRDLQWDDVSQVDPVGMEVGYRLIPLVDRGQGGELLERMKGVRRKLSEELGFLIPPVHVRDNLDLGPNGYRITLNGVPAARGEIHADRQLAIDPGRVYGRLEGTETRDPAFGLPAVWIATEQRDHAQTMGYTVVDPATVVATHLSQLLHDHAHELLGHDDAQQLLDRLAQSHPKLVENLVPKVLSLGVVLRVMQNLLSERIPIRDMRTIAETLADHGARSQDPVALTAAVRTALARFIVQGITDSAEDLPLIALDPGLEQVLQRSLQATGSAGLGIEPQLAERLQRGASEAAERQEIAGEPAVLVTSAELRPWLARWLRPVVRGLHVLAYTEIPDSRPVKVVATLGGAEAQAATA